MHIIEEIQVFKEPQSVENLVISPMQVARLMTFSMVLPEQGEGVGEAGQWLCVCVGVGVGLLLTSYLLWLPA